MNYDETTVERFCSANNFCGIPMWLKYHNYLFSTVEEKQEISFWGCPGMNFRASLPFHAMREAFAAFSKRSQRPLLFCSRVLSKI